MGLSIAGSGLQAARAAMDAAAQNLANVNTPGYLAEQALLTTSPSGDPLGIGSGTSVLGIGQATDAVLAANTLAAGATSANLNALQQTLTSAQALFPEPGSNGLAAQLSTFWSSWDTVASNPSLTAPRTEVIDQAQNLVATLNQESAQLAQIASNTTTQISTTVSHDNALLGQVASLNQSIVSSIASGDTPNSLIDQRNAVVNQLAQDIGVTTRAASNGAVDLYVGGVNLVQGTSADSLSVTSSGTPPTTSVVANLSGATVPVSGGAVAGFLAAVNADLPAYQSQLNGVAQALASTVNNQLAAGYDAAGASGSLAPLFTTASGAPFTGSATAATIAVNPAVVANPSLLAAASSATNGANDGSNAQALAALATAATGPDQLYRTFITNLGSQVQSATSQSGAETALSQALQANLAAVTGVNTDQQTVDMLSYQQAYQASAKVISTVTTMIQSLLSAT